MNIIVNMNTILNIDIKVYCNLNICIIYMECNCDFFLFQVRADIPTLPFRYNLTLRPPYGFRGVLFYLKGGQFQISTLFSSSKRNNIKKKEEKKSLGHPLNAVICCPKTVFLVCFFVCVYGAI